MDEHIKMKPLNPEFFAGMTAEEQALLRVFLNGGPDYSKEILAMLTKPEEDGSSN